MGNSVRQCLPPLVEGGPDDFEHLLRILYPDRRLRIAVQPDHAGTHIRPWDKAVRRHIRHDLRIAVILHRKGQGAVFLSARPRLHALRHLLLDHDGDALHRSAVFQKTHDDGRRDVIGQIRDNVQRFSAVILFRQFPDIRLHDVGVDDLRVRKSGQCFRKDRDKLRIDLHCHHLPRPLREVLGQRSDARSDLQDTVPGVDAGRIGDLTEHVGVDQEILPELLPEPEIIFFDDIYGILRFSKLRHILLPTSVSL